MDFNDHERHGIEVSTAATFDLDGAAGNRTDIAQFEPVGGLDRNEIAELVYYKFFYNLSDRTTGNETSTNSEAAVIKSDAFFGINLDDTNFTPSELRTGEAVDVNTLESNLLEGESTFPPAAKSSINDGLLDHVNIVRGPAITNANGYANASNGIPVIVEQNFRDIYGSGPLLDRFDDFSISHNIGAENLVGKVKSEIRGYAVFRTYEEEAQRTSFGD